MWARHHFVWFFAMFALFSGTASKLPDDFYAFDPPESLYNGHHNSLNDMFDGIEDSWTFSLSDRIDEMIKQARVQKEAEMKTEQATNNANNLNINKNVKKSVPHETGQKIDVLKHVAASHPAEKTPVHHAKKTQLKESLWPKIGHKKVGKNL